MIILHLIVYAISTVCMYNVYLVCIAYSHRFKSGSRCGTNPHQAKSRRIGRRGGVGAVGFEFRSSSSSLFSFCFFLYFPHVSSRQAHALLLFFPASFPLRGTHAILHGGFILLRGCLACSGKIDRPDLLACKRKRKKGGGGKTWDSKKKRARRDRHDCLGIYLS